MSVDLVARRQAFAPTTDPVQLARSHVPLDRLSGEPIDKELFQAFGVDRPPCAAEVKGPTGAGKSSCIVRVVRDLARLTTPRHEVLFVRAGTAGQALQSEAAFAQHLVRVVRSQGFRFSDALQEQLRALGADEVTETDPVHTRTGSAKAGLSSVGELGYQRALQEAYSQRRYGDDAARSVQELEEVVTLLRDADARPAVVIDDTDRFADPAPDGLDAESIDALMNNGVRVLGDLGIDFVVAVHPRFEETAGYKALADRYLRTRLEIPWLDLHRRPIPAILAAHLAASDIDAPIDDLVAEPAQAALWGAYTADQNLRRVLDAAQRAARQASDRRSPVIEEQDVSEALRSLGPSA